MERKEKSRERPRPVRPEERPRAPGDDRWPTLKAIDFEGEDTSLTQAELEILK